MNISYVMDKYKFLEKEEDSFSVHSLEDIFSWLNERKETLAVKLNKISLDECMPWYYDTNEGVIRNSNGTFFKIAGIRQEKDNGQIVEQPIILQNEIGFLGIISCKIEGVWHYLMQAKIEPGNVNHVQVSPTIQATKSNFTQQHGGSKPAFLEYFLDMSAQNILVDQIQSEQSSRFWGKRNRNVILMINSPIEEPVTHRWMTLAQIKELMHYDNLVNMDTRTVLSCIPYVLLGEDGDVPFKNKVYFHRTANSLDRKTIVNIYNQINNYKMFNKGKATRIPLFDLQDWKMENGEFCNTKDYPFTRTSCTRQSGGPNVLCSGVTASNLTGRITGSFWIRFAKFLQARKIPGTPPAWRSTTMCRLIMLWCSPQTPPVSITLHYIRSGSMWTVSSTP